MKFDIDEPMMKFDTDEPKGVGFQFNSTYGALCIFVTKNVSFYIERKIWDEVDVIVMNTRVFESDVRYYPKVPEQEEGIPVFDRGELINV